MPSYHTLDRIADAYTPILFLLALATLIRFAYSSQWKQLSFHSLMLVGGLVVAYALMFIDAKLQLWPMIGLDYSTHTAVALVLVMFLANQLKRLYLVAYGSLLLYCLLMLYQKYHSIADILISALIVAIFVLPINHYLTKKSRM